MVRQKAMTRDEVVELVHNSMQDHLDAVFTAERQAINRIASREQALRDMERRVEARAERLIAEAEKVAAQTTIAIVEVMEEMQRTRNTWRVIQEEQAKKEAE